MRSIEGDPRAAGRARARGMPGRPGSRAEVGDAGPWSLAQEGADDASGREAVEDVLDDELVARGPGAAPTRPSAGLRRSISAM